MDWCDKAYLYGTYGNFKLNNKIACFDLDSTLIKTKTGKKYPINYNDWDFLYTNTKKILYHLILDNYCIIIISNQGGLKTTERIK